MINNNITENSGNLRHFTVGSGASNAIQVDGMEFKEMIVNSS